MVEVKDYGGVMVVGVRRPRDGGGGQGRGQWYQQRRKVGGGDGGQEMVTMAVWW